MFDVTAFEKKMKAKNGFKKLNNDDWYYIFNAGLNSKDDLLTRINGNWYEKAKEYHFRTNITVNLYFIDKYLFSIDEANFDDNLLLLKSKEIAYFDDKDEELSKNIWNRIQSEFGLWKWFLNYGNKVTKISRDCREYTEYIPIISNAKEINIRKVENGLIELQGFSHLIEEFDIDKEKEILKNSIISLTSDKIIKENIEKIMDKVYIYCFNNNDGKISKELYDFIRNEIKNLQQENEEENEEKNSNVRRRR